MFKSIKKFFNKKPYGYLPIFGFISILIFVFIYLLLSLKISNYSSQKEIVITYADNISFAHQKVIDKFNEEYKGKIRVKPIDLPFTKFSTNERKELLARSLRSKSDKLDVFAIDLIWSARFARWAEKLNDYIIPNELDSILPAALNSCFYKDELVALPSYVDIGMMYYRKDLISRLPNSKEIEKKLKESITWEEFISLSKNFDPNVNPFYIFPADNYEGLVCSFMEILFNKNINFFENDSVDWRSKEIRSTLKLLKDMIHSHNVTPIQVTEYKDNTCYEHFVNHQGVFLRGWPSFMKDNKNLLRSKKIDDLLETAALPHISGSKPNSIIGGWNIMVSKYSENKKAALEFVRYILKEESQKILYEHGAYLPVLKNIYSDEAFMKKNKELRYNKKLLDNGMHRPFLENYTKISDVISYYTNQVLKGKISVETALNNTNRSLATGELILR